MSNDKHAGEAVFMKTCLKTLFYEVLPKTGSWVGFFNPFLNLSGLTFPYCTLEGKFKKFWTHTYVHSVLFMSSLLKSLNDFYVAKLPFNLVEV